MTITLARTAANTGFRMVYPFLPVFARGMRVSLETVAYAITLRSLLGLATPLLGSLSDRWGRRRAMVGALLLFSLAFLMLSLWPTVEMFFLALLMVSASKLILDPTVHAYLGDRVAYGRRGLAIAITEFGWSGATLVGIPLMGWMIAMGDWTTPFPLLAAIAMVLALALALRLERDPVPSGTAPSLRANLRIVFRHRTAMAGVLTGLLFSLANEAVGVVYGVWLEADFSLQVAALGAATIVIGLAELLGEGLVARLVDRLGKRRAVLWGLAANSLTALLIPLIGRQLSGALIGLFLFFLTFEFTIVSMIPLMTEILPQARATTMAAFIMGLALGRALGAPLGPPLFTLGLLTNCLFAVGANLLALGVLRAYVPE
jgi:predicted MFS family arabinose efflux permease